MLLLCCVAALCLSFYAYLFPQSNWNHTASYAGILGLLCLLIARWLWLEVRARNPTGRNVALIWALGGTLLVGSCALVSGLIDPDVLTLRGSPGAVLAIPETTAHLRFVGQQSTERNPGSLSLMLETQPGESPGLVFGQHHILGSLLLTLGSEVSAHVVAHDLAGAELTITHPSSGGFLAPLFLFHREQTIGQRSLPFDDISIPAKQEHLAAFLIDAEVAKDKPWARLAAGRLGVLVDVMTSDGHSLGHGIGFVPDGIETQIADLRLLVSFGHYPTVIITAVPQPALMFLGFFAFAGGWIRLLIRRGVC